MSSLKSLSRNFGHGKMAAEKLFLPFNIRTKKDDVVIASPVFLFEMLISERRKFSAAKFFRRLIVVDAVNGLSNITKYTKLPEPMLLDENIEHYFLDARITQDTARFIAENATIPYEDRSFGTMLMHWKIYPKLMKKAELYLGYVIRGNLFFDPFLCHAVEIKDTSRLLNALRETK